MQIALLGASGFIGGVVLKRLAAGHNVRTACRTAPPIQDGWRRLDLREPCDALEQHFDGCEVLVDSAAVTAYRIHPFDDLGQVLGTNLGIPLRLAQALPASIRRIVYLSTIDVYGVPGELPLNEDRPLRPWSNYGRTKRLAEQAYELIAAERGIELTILRLSQIYGPGDRSPKVIPTYMNAALKGKLPDLQGTGKERRDTVFVEDVARFVELALAGPAGTYNVATGQSRTVSETVRLIADLAGLTPPKAVGGDGGPDYVFDIRKAREQLGFESEIPLEAGLRRTWEWLRGRSSS